MSDHKHTPGPWRVERQRHTNGSMRRAITSASGYPLAYANGDPGPPERTEANARLMAAAPALRDALAEWLDADEPVAGVTYTSRGGFGRDKSELDAERAQEERLREAKRKARAALALADGQEEA